MTRLHKNEEEEILMSKIRQLVEKFGQTVFTIGEIESVGGTQRTTINEGVFWRDKAAIVETLNSLRKRDVIKYEGEILLQTPWDFKDKNFKFEVMPENIGDLKPFQTPIDIFKDMKNFLENNLVADFKTVNNYLRSAENSLAVKDKLDYSDVGHFCQLAYEDFLNICCKKLTIDVSGIKLEHTGSRLLEIAEKNKVGETHTLLIKALIDFHYASSKFNEKNEHRDQNTIKTNYKDAEKGFFYTYLIIQELYAVLF